MEVGPGRPWHDRLPAGATPDLNRDFSTLIASAEGALDSGRNHHFAEVLGHLRGLAGNSAERWRQLGLLCSRAGDPAGAEAALGRAITLEPRDAEARVALAAVLRATGRAAPALDQVEAACRLAPSAAPPAHLMGLLHLEQGLAAAALDWLLRARDNGGDSADLHADLGLALQTLGRPDEAEASYGRALERAPQHDAALRGLARLARVRRRPEEGLVRLEPLIPQIRSGGALAEIAGLMAAADRPRDALAMLESCIEGVEDTEGRMEIRFRMGELHDAAGDHEAAMEDFLLANRMKQVSFDPSRYAGLVDRLLAVFDEHTMQGLPRAAHGDHRPIFIVGMPRSGTSLVEQILASHPQVFGAGELGDLGLLALSTATGDKEYPESVPDLVPDDVERLATAYRQRLDALAPGARRVTDKMWQNFEFLGFIAMLFPEARVIHCKRDPMDAGLSCFFHHFYGTGIAFSYDLEHIGAYYRQYRRIMEHWESVLPLPILEVSYECLVTDTEAGIRELVDFADIPWDPACLSFFDTERVVRTASLDQIRRPVYRTSVGRHRHYRRWLGPLARALAGEA